MPTPPHPKFCNPCHLARTLLYRTIAEHYEIGPELVSSGQFDGQGDLHTPTAYMYRALVTYGECGMFAHGFARARCDQSVHDYLVAISILIRSGRFEVWSLGEMRKISEEGVRFASPVNGDKLLLTPEGLQYVRQRIDRPYSQQYV